MKNVLLAVMVLAVFGLAIYYALTVPFLYIYLPLAGWVQFRRLGYSPTKTIVVSC